MHYTSATPSITYPLTGDACLLGQVAVCGGIAPY